MADEIPFERLGIPAPLRPRVVPDAPNPPKLALARGVLPTTPDVLLAVCYVLTEDPSTDVAQAARETFVTLPLKQLLSAISERTHPKILEFLAEVREGERELDQRLLRLRAINTRAARILTRRADAELCDDIARNHERLLMSPEVLIDLHANPHATDAVVEKAKNFLILEGDPPQLPPIRPFLAAATPAAAPAPTDTRLQISVEAELDAWLRGHLSPALQRALGDAAGAGAFADHSGRDLGQFRYDFYDEGDFDSLLITDFSEQGGMAAEERKSLVAIISAMNVTQKIKLAFLGNKEARAILIRDKIKSVPTAVIRSGRMTDAEVVSYAGDRNLPRDVIRQIAIGKEFIRKYPVQVALCNNPKTPIQNSIGFLKNLSKKDLTNLSRNKNIPSSLAQLAAKMGRSDK